MFERLKEDIAAASERIALEEYFLLITAFRCSKGGKEEARAFRYSCTKEDMAAFISRFPFPFTDGQNKAVADILADCAGPHRMNRLLQGDVGCGKTAVALCGVYMAAKSGYQAAMIAPTEVLAAQNFALVRRYMPEMRVAFLAGSTPAKEKREIKRALAAGEIDVVVGTHALLQADVQPKALAFCVCDEQHRFGVAQRSALGEKGAGAEMLVKSATPIPRTLSLIFYGDLDISEIRDKPKARAPVVTAVIPRHKYDDMLEYIAAEAKKGNQSYFVCPKIEGDEEGSLMSVTELFDTLKNRLPGVRFALLHGKMKDKEKAEVMAAFKDKKYDCLVSTTVIEVGVDVPSATIMVIYNAERFGLSQLHQLRGRVGRGDKKSYCFLLPGADSPEARERLAAIRASSDGFAIAEKDLELRGGGDFFGTRQSGHVISDIKNDGSIPKYASNLIYINHSRSDDEVDDKLIYSIINKQPKRADHYWIFNLSYVDTPNTLEYSFKTLVPGTLFCVNLRIGFRIEPRVSLYLRQIVEDLVKTGEIDLASTYPSLRKNGIAGDFRFIMIHRVYYPEDAQNSRQNLLMSLYSIIRKIGIDETKALGLDTSVVVVERVPLIIGGRAKNIRRIERIL